jgi:hypothetical protein
MASLKAFLPHMANWVGTTADALYTRQRALVELGVLKFVDSRGPGSATPLDGSGVAALVIALLAADTLQDTDIRVRDFCRAKPNDAGKCPWTGEADFQSALAAVLTSKEKAESLRSVSVQRYNNRAALGYGHPNESVFVSPGPLPRSAIRISASVEAANLRRLAAFLQAEMAGQDRREER